MALFLNKTNMISQLRNQSQKSEGDFALTRRGFHTELGAREKALLAEDPALTRFKSHKKDVRRIKKVGDLLTIIVVAAAFVSIVARLLLRALFKSYKLRKPQKWAGVCIYLSISIYLLKCFGLRNLNKHY